MFCKVCVLCKAKTREGCAMCSDTRQTAVYCSWCLPTQAILEAPVTWTSSLKRRVIEKLAVSPVHNFIQDYFIVTLLTAFIKVIYHTNWLDCCNQFTLERQIPIFLFSHRTRGRSPESLSSDRCNLTSLEDMRVKIIWGENVKKRVLGWCICRWYGIQHITSHCADGARLIANNSQRENLSSRTVCWDIAWIFLQKIMFCIMESYFEF